MKNDERISDEQLSEETRAYRDGLKARLQELLERGAAGDHRDTDAEELREVMAGFDRLPLLIAADLLERGEAGTEPRS